MARSSSSCRQADITKLLRAAFAAGVPLAQIRAVQLTRDGAIILFGPQPLELGACTPLAPASENEWDEVLKR